MQLTSNQILTLAQGQIPPLIRSFYSAMGITLPPIIRPLVEPFDQSLVNPASLDIRIGHHAALLTANGWSEINLGTFTEDRPFSLMPYPADRILVSSLETFNLPNFLTGVFKLKSSRGREFYENVLAGFCDPGWHGSKLTMELVNLNVDPLPLYPGLKIGQMAFTLTLGIPEADYSKTGRYNNDTGAARSRG
jgi:dCTP deaminase